MPGFHQMKLTIWVFPKVLLIFKITSRKIPQLCFISFILQLIYDQVSTKKLNWSAIPVKNIQKTTFWAKTKELEMESPDLLESLSEEFAAKAAKGIGKTLFIVLLRTDITVLKISFSITRQN